MASVADDAQGAVQARAVDEKELGNRAFGAKEFSQAVVHFSRCIELDPECALLSICKLPIDMSQARMH